MNDLVPPPRRDLPAGHHENRRAHLLAELETSGRARSRAPRRRTAVGAVTALGLAAGAAAVVVIAPGGTTSPPGPSTAQTLTPMSATEVLNRAAQAAADGEALDPRPDQFRYSEAKTYNVGVAFDKDGDVTGRRERRARRQVWLSMDGTRAGLIERDGGAPDTWVCKGSPDPRAGTAARDLDDPPTGCRNAPADLGGLPTDVEAMRRWLYETSRDQGPPHVQAFATVGTTIRGHYLAPEALSAIFEAAAKIPGVTVTRDMTDLAGRKGIAVGQTWGGMRHELIFDPETYAFMGERRVVDFRDTVHPSPSPSPDDRAEFTVRRFGEPGTLISASAVLKVGVTDEVGQVPK